MIRVVFLIRSLHEGGTERQLATLLPRLHKDRFDVTVITFYSGGPFAKSLTANHIRVISLDKRGRWDLLVLRRLVAELKQRRPAILHSYLVEPNVVATLIKPLLRGTKVVWGLRTSDMHLSQYDWFTRMNFKLQILLSGFADLAIFNSRAGRDYHFKSGLRTRETLVIRPGIETDEFKPDAELRRQGRQDWAPNDDTLLVGLIARLDPIKGHSTFLKAAALLASERPECRFICVGAGSGEYAAGMRRLGEELGLSDRLVWAGSRTDMSCVYNAMDIVCCSSVSEGLPNVVAEAMACDVPCVVTDVGDSALLVGDTGVVVPANDERALAGGLNQCIEDIRARRLPSPRVRIVNSFGVEQLVEQTEGALAGVYANARFTGRSRS
ncbi:MAG TPA: glycosyltransferase [Pyrinomonadaceae bacterium]|nr:glycosyltransferase [Pyrinomonadaceae bacterium]